MRLTALLLLAVVAAAANAYENDSLNLDIPSGLKAGAGEVSIQHRFYGPLGEDTWGTAFGMTEGANVALGLRWQGWRGFETSTRFAVLDKEYNLALGYALAAGVVAVEPKVSFFSYELVGMDDRRQNFFYTLSTQSGPYRFFYPTVVFAYDGYEERFGAAAGLALTWKLDRGYLQRFALLGEYYPVINRDEERTGDHDVFAAGVELQTFRHHFAFLVSNSAQIGTRRLMLGAPDTDLFVGFNITRECGL